MTRALVLHLGDHKTGSTSIQQVLFSGAVQAEQSLFFPAGRPPRPHHNHIARAMIRKVKPPKHQQHEAELLTALAAEISGSSADIAVISAEHFEFADPAQLATVLETYLPDLAPEARLIAYIRPHGERLLSSYAERVKQGLFLGDLEEFHRETDAAGAFHYAPRLEKWRAVFGDRFTARPMIRSALKQGDVVQDFLDWVFGGRPFTVKALAQTNEKLSLQDLAVLREVQNRLEDVRAQNAAPREPVRALGWRLARMLSNTPAPEATPLALHESLVADVQRVYAADAAEVDAAFFGGATLLTDALARLSETAVAEPQALELERLVAPETYRLCVGWIQLVHDLYILKPGEWRPYFQANPLKAGAVAVPGDLDAVLPGSETGSGDLEIDWDDGDENGDDD